MVEASPSPPTSPSPGAKSRTSIKAKSSKVLIEHSPSSSRWNILIAFIVVVVAAAVAWYLGFLNGLPSIDNKTMPFSITSQSDSGASIHHSKSKKIFTKDELKQYDGTDPNKPILLAILGEVFDVSKGGKKYYGKGSSYNFFTGRDGSRAFVTGEFNEKGLIDDIDELTPKQVKEIVRWRTFFQKDYTFVGYLNGRYYNEQGNPTDIHDKIYELLEQAEQDEALSGQEQKQYPTCNSRWAEKQGGNIWCDPDHVRGTLVPRKFFSNIERHERCACVPLAEAMNAAQDKFKLYQNCAPDSATCPIPP